MAFDQRTRGTPPAIGVRWPGRGADGGTLPSRSFGRKWPARQGQATGEIVSPRNPRTPGLAPIATPTETRRRCVRRLANAAFPRGRFARHPSRSTSDALSVSFVSPSRLSDRSSRVRERERSSGSAAVAETDALPSSRHCCDCVFDVQRLVGSDQPVARKRPPRTPISDMTNVGRRGLRGIDALPIGCVSYGI
jgi:hypothetical protein